jgi:hypothetical protein
VTKTISVDCSLFDVKSQVHKHLFTRIMPGIMLVELHDLSVWHHGLVSNNLQ